MSPSSIVAWIFRVSFSPTYRQNIGPTWLLIKELGRCHTSLTKSIQKIMNKQNKDLTRIYHTLFSFSKGKKGILLRYSHTPITITLCKSNRKSSSHKAKGRNDDSLCNMHIDVRRFTLSKDEDEVKFCYYSCLTNSPLTLQSFARKWREKKKRT